MKKSLIYLFLCAVVMASCQKEPSVELPDNGIPIQAGGANRLSKIVYQYSATDSVYTEFFYDSQGRWTGHRTTGDDYAIFTSTQALQIIRNPSGYITQYTVTDLDAAGFPEKTTYTVNYDVNAKRYTSRVTEYELNGSIVVDSTVFTFNGGQLATQRFLFKEKTSGVFLEVGALEIVYDAAGKPITVNTLIADPQTAVLAKIAEIDLQFDDKTAALNLGLEALITDQLYFASPNNITLLNIKDLSDPADIDEESLQIQYEYNSAKKPVSAQVTADGQTVAMFFRYG